MNSGTQIKTELLANRGKNCGSFCVALGEPAFRGAQIYHALYAERNFDMGQITNLPLALRNGWRERRASRAGGEAKIFSSDAPCGICWPWQVATRI